MNSSKYYSKETPHFCRLGSGLAQGQHGLARLTESFPREGYNLVNVIRLTFMTASFYQHAIESLGR